VTGLLGGYAFKSKDWIEQGVPVVKIGSVKPGIVDLSVVSYVSDQVAEEAKRFRLAPGDLLIGMTGYVGEVGLVPDTDNPPLLNQRVGKFVLERPGTSALAFLYCVTRQPEFKAQVETKSHGTAQANVSAEGILSIHIIVPPKTLRDEFNRIAQPLIDRILATHAESVSLAAQRDTLLLKLISGELRVADAKKMVARADA
jgi:type I restriction enzyme S subunit